MFGLNSYFFDYFYHMSGLCCEGNDVVTYGQRRLSRPHHSGRMKKGSRAKAGRRSKVRRCRK